MNFLEVQDYLEKVRQRKGMVLGLDTMRHLMEKLGNPQDKVKFIQIAGTNGKGSTAAYLTSILTEAGIKTGRYTSPAVFSCTEQYFACGKCMTEEEYARGMTEVAKAASQLEGESPTAFEQETALAFWYFAQKGCELAVLEAGLGGDMDATNIVQTTVCSIITSISMDHCRILGDTPAKIARHKAGIIKKEAPTICIEQDDEAMQQIRETAKNQNSLLYEVRHDEVRQVFSDKRESVVFFRDFENLRLKMLGSFQPENAALAIQAASVLSERYQILRENIYSGIKKTYWEGRFELHTGNPDIILDGAHNPGGIKKLKESITHLYSAAPITYVMGVLADKDYDKEIQMLLGHASKVYTVTPPSPRAMESKKLCEAIKKHFEHLEVTACDSIEKALDNAATDSNPVVVCGTLTILAEAKKWLAKR